MVIVFILIFGLILRLVNLNQSLWLDEAVQAITSRGTFQNIFYELSGDFHPPLYHMFMWFWVHFFGSSEVILRLPSVIFGTVTIYVVYRIGQELLTKEKFSVLSIKYSVPSVVALFLAVAPFHIYYSQEARPYALVAFLVSLSMYFFLKKKWFYYVIATVLALYSSYFAFFILLAQGLVSWRSKNSSTIRYQVISIFLFFPWLPMLVKQISVGKEAVSVLPQWGILVSASFVKALPLTFIKFIIGRITIFDKTIYGLLTIFLFMVYGFLLTKGILIKKAVVNLWLIMPVAFALLLSLSVPNYQPFRLLFVLPAFYLLLVLGLTSINQVKIKFLLTGIIVVVSFLSLYQYYSNPYFWREDWRGTVGFIESQKNAYAILPSSTSNWSWQYYSSGKVKLIGISPGVKMVVPGDFDKITLRLRSGQAIQQYSNITIYYIRYLQSVFDPQEKILLWLKENGYNKTGEISFNQISVWEYTK